MLQSAKYVVVCLDGGKCQWLGHAHSLEDGQAFARRLRYSQGTKRMGVGHMNDNGDFVFDWTEDA